MKILQTPGLQLREFTHQDADALALVLSDPETMRYYTAPYDRAGVEQWIERNRRRYQSDGVGLWAMELTKTPDSEVPKIIGDCGIILQQVEGERLYEIGYQPAPRLLGPGSGDRSRHRLPRLGIRALENRSLDFPDSPRESALTPRGRARRHDHLEGSELARLSTLRLFHRNSAIIVDVTQTHVRVVTGLCPVPAGPRPATTQSPR